ncbi:hypothetical protein EMN47_16510 [Prolixibacteraceae bacterium JC049]|nr:hypothetical protein [Prolixibacteraceae bacterium JC049]
MQKGGIIMRQLMLLCLLCTVNFVFAQEKSHLKWWNPNESKTNVIQGQAWPNQVKSKYHRLPEKVKDKVRTPVWNLGCQSAGLSIRFETNAQDIYVRYWLKGGIAFPHMPATGVSGVDLFRISEHGKRERCWGTYSLGKKSEYHFCIEDENAAYSAKGLKYQLFLPLYNEVDSLEIGVDTNDLFKVLPANIKSPIVAYGTSICQGACASRPGMNWGNILQRRLNIPFINLGFSGNGRLEPELISLLTEIEAKLYILDCLPNLKPDKDDTYNLVLSAVRQIRKKRPNVPIILTEHIGYANWDNNRSSKEKYEKLNKALQLAFGKLKENGVNELYLLSKRELNLGIDSYVDYIHPNDYGMIQYANAYEKLIKEILNR